MIVILPEHISTEHSHFWEVTVFQLVTNSLHVMQLDGILSQKCPQPVHIKSHIQPHNVLQFYSFKINFNIIPHLRPVLASGFFASSSPTLPSTHMPHSPPSWHLQEVDITNPYISLGTSPRVVAANKNSPSVVRGCRQRRLHCAGV
jgi:hypothetical protein